MDFLITAEKSVLPYVLKLEAVSLIPILHYLLGVLFIIMVLVYNFFEIHFIHDFLTCFKGDKVSLSYNSCSELYHSVGSKCQILHGRYLATLWLSSPHLQTVFLSLFGRPPIFSYKRKLFHMPDEGTIALDWLMNSDGAFNVDEEDKDNEIPIVIVIPGLTSDSDSAYIKHLAWKLASHGCNVVVCNHRGLGGLSLTSDCFYNAGWTEDLRRVKYLGEDGANTPIVGAAAVGSPWDLLICDRFINRKLVQKFYDRVLTIGLQGYAKLHRTVLSRLADWECIEKSCSVRDFDNYATRIVGNYETVDTYYRHCSSSSFVRNVSVPLLCISALDDPVCTREAIPWDECRQNENIILATTRHGGHLAFYEGICATSLWWVRAVDEFFGVLRSSHIKRGKKMNMPIPPESYIDQAPYVNVMGDGMVTAASNTLTNNTVEDVSSIQNMVGFEDNGENVSSMQNMVVGIEDEGVSAGEKKDYTKNDLMQPSEKNVNEAMDSVRRSIDRVRNKNTIWLLAYIAIITTWPLVGSALLLVLKKRCKNFSPPKWLRR